MGPVEHRGNDMQDACHEPPMNACDKIHTKVRDQLWKILRVYM
jgi:hypothetical protein